MPPIIQVHNLRKSYGSVLAADDISFQVQRGEIFRLLRPNGAGKTTTLECLEGIRQPDLGELAVLGVNPSRPPGILRRLIGVQLQIGGLPDAMTVDEALRFFAAYHGVAPRRDLLERLGLGDKLGAQYHQLSIGLRHRLALALATTFLGPLGLVIYWISTAEIASPSLHSGLRLLRPAILRLHFVPLMQSVPDSARNDALASSLTVMLGAIFLSMRTG